MIWNPLRAAAFLRAYRYLPHHLINRCAARVMAARRPRWAVRAAIRLWVRAADIDVSECAPARHGSLSDFFLRRLRDGARPLEPGLVSPVDGVLVAAGRVAADTTLDVKGQRLRLARLINGSQHQLDLRPFYEGTYVVIFLTPHGYHHIHMPDRGQVLGAQRIPGRYFPQNQDALRHIPAIYERNERVVLRLLLDRWGPALLVLVGASLVGGIHVHGATPDAPPDAPIDLAPREKGAALAHFSFGSTIVLIWPGDHTGALSCPEGARVRMGQAIMGGTTPPTAG